jgi:hypothetical protein
MNAKTTPAPAKVSDRSLLTEVHQLREFLIKAKHDYDRRRRVHHLLFKAFIKGMVSGLGVIAAVAIVSPIIVLLLRWVQWPPLVANFVTTVIHQIELANPRLLQGAVDQ